MKLIDCNCAIGYRTVNYEVVNHEHFFVRERVNQARDAEQLLEQLDFCGIEGAVVTIMRWSTYRPGRATSTSSRK
jgi:hypothetical protein